MNYLLFQIDLLEEHQKIHCKKKKIGFFLNFGLFKKLILQDGVLKLLKLSI